MSGKFKADESAAATELGYIFTFLLGVMLLSMFSLWAFGIENSTRENWNDAAIKDNADRIASAIERADSASRNINNASYAEPVHLTDFDAAGDTITLLLLERELIVDDSTNVHSLTIQLSGAGNSSHSGEINLNGIDVIWVIHENGQTYITTKHPSW
ncbi:MAG TPA: hypothetical protein EYQ53_01340 [Candidatus Poseidoniales archaeon]|jgi:hypothetical protein|nr:MAG: hypothetical protein CXT69_00220 [Euryarchaeota archaeon]HIG03018.1 hypothetical protein [Candidatus Poseidoniales archaeon]HIK79242.1 hypothetical protein [Candidatus Poseidoniales archaeon]